MRALNVNFCLHQNIIPFKFSSVKAMRLLQKADLVLYDRLVSMDILDMIHPGAKLLYVGKTSGYHSRTQVLTLKHICVSFPSIISFMWR